MFLRIFLFFRGFQLGCSYKLFCYKKKSVRGSTVFRNSFFTTLPFQVSSWSVKYGRITRQRGFGRCLVMIGRRVNGAAPDITTTTNTKESPMPWPKNSRKWRSVLTRITDKLPKIGSVCLPVCLTFNLQQSRVHDCSCRGRLGRGSNDLGRGMLKYKLSNP